MRDNSGAAGIAWLGTVCGSKAYRTNINEYYYNDLDTAQVIPFIINLVMSRYVFYHVLID